MAATTVPLPEPPKSVVHTHHNRDLALQKYLLLQEQHEFIRQHLDLMRPSLQTSIAAISHTTPNSLASSPTEATYPSPLYSSTQASSPYQSRSSSQSRGAHNNTNDHNHGGHNHQRYHHQSQNRRASLPAVAMTPRSAATTLCTVPVAASGLETVPDEATLSSLAAEEARLCDVNEGIKRALTELLNCQVVRNDRAFRTWVQCRLMDTERELRSGRRRRSAPEP